MAKGLIRKAIAGTAVGVSALYLAGSLTLSRMNEYLLSPEYFDNAEWCESFNPNGSIWDEYMNSGIPHNMPNWQLYAEKVREKNRGNLKGTIYLPCSSERSS